MPLVVLSEAFGPTDAEALALAPRALDLLALEDELDARTAAAFVRGYEAVLPLPDLGAVRGPYRFLLYLLTRYGDPGGHTLEDWLAWPPVLGGRPPGADHR